MVPGGQGVGLQGLRVSMRTFGWNFADVTMADEDTNLILTDDVSTIGQFGVDGRHLHVVEQ